jgi:hypothetical protein
MNNNDDKWSLDESSITIGSCYSVSLDGRSSFVKIIRCILPNPQGAYGPVKWIGERVGEADESQNEGKQVALTISDFIGRAKARDMLVQAIRIGWKTDKDIHDYLHSCGVPINIKTVASYKSKYRSDKFFKKENKAKRDVPIVSLVAEGVAPAALISEIVQVAKMAGGLKALVETVESIRKTLEDLCA